MKILWIVNIVMPQLAEYMGVPVAASGSWLVDISHALAENQDNKLAIACVYGNQFKKIEIGNTVYYVLPGNGRDMLFYSKKVAKQWQMVYDDFKPDIVHVHGTEYSHGLSFLRKYPDVPSVISIQGILNRIKDVDFGNIQLRHFIFGRTLKQWLKMNGEIELHFIHKKNAKHEKEMFSRVDAVNGVNIWDTSIAKSINPKLKVYKIDYNLREEFYTSRKWDIKKINRHTIFTNPGGVPLKGLHMLIKACALLKDKYPDIKIRVPGMNGVNGNVCVTGAYSKYLNKLIKQLGMQGKIEFLGKQTGSQMMENCLNAHITVIPSAIEGTSLILRESMFLGVPCIASFRGGMAEYISSGNDGFSYDFPEYTILAEYIDKLFGDDELCKTLSRNAIEKSELAHERKSNALAYEQMYKEVLNK